MKDFLQKITTEGKAMYLAYDHGFEHGPADLPGKSIDPNYILNIAVEGGYNAVILQKGLAEKYYTGTKYQKQVPLILKINGKANIWQGGDIYSYQNCSVQYAKQLGASAVGYTIYLGSAHDGKMFADFGRIVEEAHKLNMAVIAWVYPRGEFVKDETSKEITAYAARIGLELGADMVKIKYSGSRENFEYAVKAAGKTRVVLSGGPKVSDEEFLQIMRDVIAAGAIGVAVGRNVWQHPEPLEITRKIREIIFS
ncbi:MAG TPA: aldolase [Candidatus Paceibacterota bacterium]|nr:aldolase [Candidatus Paceibacterota bacterium]HOK20598.1 aldolase [Candidatus Paceibacterota bacterium]HOL54000.1 aldolase [Candidatus Paceibacterota bacterium]HON21750.1 aldolase [Candidatus Paceibacterota bacterium]HPP17079.1 aldolase [Candidatus Paceibacterota bacterium]